MSSVIIRDISHLKMANLVMLGALAETTGLLSFDIIRQQLEAHLSARHRKWLEPNKRALAKGAELAR